MTKIWKADGVLNMNELENSTTEYAEPAQLNVEAAQASPAGKETLGEVTAASAIDPEEERKLNAKKAKRRRIWGKIKLVILTLIAAIFAISFLLPTVLTIANSFMSEQEISSNYGVVFNTYSGDKDSTKQNYKSEKVNLKLIPDTVVGTQYETVLLKSPEYLLKFWNSVIYTVPIMIFQIFVALGAAYSFSRWKGKVRILIFFLYIILMLTPYQVTLVPNYIVSEKMGIIDSIWAIILPGVFAPFSVFLLTKYMNRIPESLVEAAKLDGATEWQIFTKIYVPLCKGALASVAILVFIDYWNMVEQPLVLLSNPEMHPLSVFLSQINQGEIGLAFSVATIYMVPPILIFLYGEEYLVDGIAYSGAVKG